MSTTLNLLPCDRVPIQQCLEAGCNQCLRLLEEITTEPEMVEVSVSIALPSSMQTI